MNDNLIEKIQYEYNSLSKTHRIIADIFLSNCITRDTTLVEVAKLGYCSHSTVLRFIHILGYKNFQVFMDDYFNHNSRTNFNIIKSFELVDNYYNINNQDINNFIKQLKITKKIYIFANGMSYLPAYNLYYKGNMITNKFVLLTEFSTDLTINADDIAIFISNSGNSKKLRVLSQSLQNYYLISNYGNSPLAKQALINFNLENRLETAHMMDTQPRESIYSLLYFTDYIISQLTK